MSSSPPSAAPARTQHAGEHWIIVPDDHAIPIAVVNRTGHDVLTLCDGLSDPSAISQRIAHQTGADPAQVARDVEDFLEQAHLAGLVQP